MPGAPIHDISVDRAGPVAVQERKILPIRLGQLVVEEFGVTLSVRLVLLLHQAVPNPIPVGTEAGDCFQSAEPRASLGAPDGVAEGHKWREQRRFLPACQYLC